MPRVLVVSSQVACGTVGLQATVPALWHAGVEVFAVPTILLSNHPGHAHIARATVAPRDIDSIIEALDANGWLGTVDAVLSGYVPTPEHAATIAATVDRVFSRTSRAIYVCDPILGDDPRGLYIAPDAAEAIRVQLLPRAQIVTPNRFELAWLSRHQVNCVSSASVAARTLGPSMTVATSIPAAREGWLANLLVTSKEISRVDVVRKASAPHGTGDVFAGLFTGRLLCGDSPEACLAYAATTLDHILAKDAPGNHLNLSLLR